mgnify:FL=1
MSKIYVIEDEIAISKAIRLNLEAAGYEVATAYNGDDVMAALFDGQRFDLAILDIMIPGKNGFELLKPLTDRGIPVIFLTAKSDVDSKVTGLSDGAEDYITKPFAMPELLVRVEKVLERYGRADKVLSIDDLTINVPERNVKKNNEALSLTPIEFDLLLVLARNKNIALSRDKLLAEVWGQLFEGETRTVDVHIAQLRKKTGLQIVSVPKVGYRLEETL